MDAIRREIEGILPMFMFMIREFDSAAEVRESLRATMRSDVFRKAYAELGYPQYFNKFRPLRASEIAEPVWAATIFETLEIHDILVKAVQNENWPLWEELKADYISDMLTHLRRNVSCFSIVMYNQSVWELVTIARHSRSIDLRRGAVLRLVELDANFLRTSFAHRALQSVDLESDTELRRALSRVLDPKQLRSSLEKYRQKRALEALLSFRYQERSYADWSAFFKCFNSLLGKKIDLPRNRCFSSFENPDTIRRALKRLGIRKKPQKPGRHRKPSSHA